MKKFLWIAGILVAFFAVSAAPSDLRSNNEVFDAQLWKISDSRTRGQMVKSLLKQKDVLNGKSISEVKEMLGEPDLQDTGFVSYHFKKGFLFEEVFVSKMYVFAQFDKNTGIFTSLSIVDR